MAAKNAGQKNAAHDFTCCSVVAVGEGAMRWLVSMEPQVEHMSAEQMSLHASSRSRTTNAAPCDMSASRSISPTRIPPPTCKVLHFFNE
jgi:hypothetical protein